MHYQELIAESSLWVLNSDKDALLSPAPQLTLGSHILVGINCWYKTEA